MEYRRKLIEVALPLDAINAASKKEKSIFHGHPSALHLWWSRKPLAACRAVLFASLVDDPSANPDKYPTESAQDAERERLFELIRELVLWENSNDTELLGKARTEIANSCGELLPSMLDPFAGGGSIPVEAQRLGLETHASDLNPVAVLINKALIEIPPLFADQPPVHPDPDQPNWLDWWSGAQGLAADVKYYSQWMRDLAEARIGHLYPKVELPAEHGGGQANVIAWLWTRSVACPNPACGAEMPLASSWWLCKKKGRETWVKPVVDLVDRKIRYEIGTGTDGPPEPPKIGRAKFRCIFCGETCPDGWVKAEADAGRVNVQLMAVAAEGHRQRIYLPPTEAHKRVARVQPPDNSPNGDLPDEALGFRVQRYGMAEWTDLFTSRQLGALCTFSDLASEARKRIVADALASGMSNDLTPLREGGTGALAYAEALLVYLTFCVSKCADYWSSICTWDQGRETMGHTFPRQAVQMTWDYCEANPFSDSTGNWAAMANRIAIALANLPVAGSGYSVQKDASAVEAKSCLVSTDPPYYDNIGYADLSDFFYLWLQRSLREVYPSVFSTLLTPKTQELIAGPQRHQGDKSKARDFFQTGFQSAFVQLKDAQDLRYPMTVFYAFKQTETVDGDTASTGWETMLQGMIDAGLTITGTWPIRSERSNRMRSLDSNALASSIVLACRPRPNDAPLTSQHDFRNQLSAELPRSLHRLQQGNIAPVDLAQAAIGPGMEVFSRYNRVVKADGSPMSVREALVAINQALDEILESAESELDADTRWALTWHAQHGFHDGDYGVAEQLSKSRNTSVAGLVEAGIATSGGGRVRLLPRDELDPHWNPATDTRLTAWEVTHHLISRLQSRGEEAAADLLRQVGGFGESARELAYRLYHTCERKNWASDALAYNSLVSAWPELTRLANKPPPGQIALGLEDS